ncbi:MAG TPA: DUF5706 domain-containing protein [Phycisphaerales bacterium]|nr:DUF5706 domain-containing protein [Phycisphaerales bacterium]
MNDANKSDLATRAQLQERVLDRQLEWIRGADTKVTIVIGFDTALLGSLALLAAPSENLGWRHVVLGACALTALLSLILCVVATFPRTKGPPGSLIYFGGIAKHSPDSYHEAVVGRNEAEYLRDLNSQCHRNAVIAKHKYSALRHAMGWLMAGIVSWLLTLYFLCAP